MKHVDNQIHTIPEGVWEAGQTDETLHASHHASPAVDAQGNGYPKTDNKPTGHLRETKHPHKEKDCRKIH